MDACKLTDLKKDSIAEAMRIFRGNANTISPSPYEGDVLHIRPSEESKTVKTMASAHSMVKSNIERVENWAKKEFGERYQKGWVQLQPVLGADRFRVQFSFPKQLENHKIVSYIKQNRLDLLTGYEEIIEKYNLLERFLPEANYSMKAKGGVTDTINPKNASAWLEARGIPHEITSKIVNDNPNSEVLGMFSQGMVYLSEMASVGTEYHEAFHAVFRTYLNEDQQVAILNEEFDNHPIISEELYDLEKQGYFTVKEDGTAWKTLIKDGKETLVEISNEKLTALVLEERLAEKFRAYVMSNQAAKPVNSKIAKFFKDLWNYIKTYLSNKRTVDQLFSNIESGLINKTFVNERFKGGDAMAKRQTKYSAQEQDEIVDSLITAWIDTYDRTKAAGIPEENIDPNDILNNIKEYIIKQAFRVRTANGDITLPTYEQAVRHHELLKEGDPQKWKAEKDPNLGTNNTYIRILRDIYDDWFDVQDEYGNINNTRGWEYLVKKKLSKFGYRIGGDLVGKFEEETGEKIYGKASVEVSRKDTMSGDVKKFLMRIERKNKDGETITNILGFNSYVPFDTVYEKLALAVTEATDWKDMLSKIEYAAKKDNDMLTIYNELASKHKTKSRKDIKFLADFYKNMAMTYNNFVGAIEELDIVEVNGEKEVNFSIKYYNANNNRVSKVLRNKWRERSRRPDGVGIMEKNINGNYVPNTRKIKKLSEYLETIKEIRNTRETVSDKHVDAMLLFANTLGIDLNKDILNSALKNGVKIGNKRLSGSDLYWYLWDGKHPQSKSKVGLSKVIEHLEEGSDIHERDQNVIGRFVNIIAPFTDDYHGSFLNGENKSIYPINMHTTLTRMFGAYKEYGLKGEFWNKFVEDFRKDPWFFPDANLESRHNSLFLSEILSKNSNFTDIFHWEDFDTYKKKNETVSKNTYQNLSPVLTHLHRLNAFSNNGSTKEMKIVLPTLSDRDKMVLITVPRISYVDKLHGYRTKTVDDILIGYIKQDIARMKQLTQQMETLPKNKRVKHLHDKASIKFVSFEFLNDTPIGKKLIEFATGSSQEQMLEENIKEMYTQAKKEIDKYIENQVAEQIKLLGTLGISTSLSSSSRKKNPIDPNGLKLYQERSSTKATKKNIDDFMKDFVVSNIIATNEIKRMTSGDPYTYKKSAQGNTIEDESKRYGGLATPGYETWLNEWSSEDYGDKASYKIAVIKDIFRENSENLKELEKIAGAEAVAAYKKTFNESSKKWEGGSNVADAMGFTTLDKHRAKMMGQGTWDLEHHELAYNNYKAGGEFSYKKAGKTIRPKLNPIKTYHDGLYMVNGKKTRIIVKHATFPLLREFTKSSPIFEAMRKRMEETPGSPIDEINMDSAIKSGLHGAMEIEDGVMPDFTQLTTIELQTRFQRIPQVIPEVAKKNKIGSQLMKLVIGNLEENLNTDYELANGLKIKGQKLLDLYNDTIDQMLNNNLEKLEKRLGYDEYMRSDKSPEAKLKFLQKLRNILRQSIEERDLPANYEMALNISQIEEYIPELEKEISTFGYETPLAFPVYGKKFEQIIMSLFRNNVMNLKINGGSLVQIAELGGTSVQTKEEAEELTKTLQFVKAEDGKIKHAEVAIPWKFAEKLGLSKNKFGEYELSDIKDQSVLNMIGYRIPTQGKNSMLPLKIVKVLPESMGKSIMVPAEITTQMGSDFDVDKLFLMMPNLDTKSYTKDGQEWNEFGAFASYLKKEGFEDLDDGEIQELLDDTDNVDNIYGYDPIELKPVVVSAKKFIDKKAKELGVDKYQVKRMSYNPNDLSTNSPKQLENLYFDLVEAILTNPAHLKEMITTVDSPTMKNLAKELSKGETKLDPQNIQTQEILERRNKTGSTGIGIYATNLTAQAARQGGQAQLAPEYAVKFDAKSKNDKGETSLTKVRDGSGALISYLFNKHLNIAVDNAKEPLMDILNDNEFTSPVTSIIISSGVSNPKLKNKKLEFTGESTEIATYFRSQPIIVALYERFINDDEASLADLRAMAEEVSSYISTKYKLQLKESKENTVFVDSYALKNTIGKELKDLTKEEAELQLDVLHNFIKYHKAGRDLVKFNKVLNADRISNMSSMAYIEEFMDIKNYLLDPERNKTILGTDAYIEFGANPITRSYLRVLDRAQEVAGEFFPFNKDGLFAAKEKIRNDQNKDSLDADTLNAVNNSAMIWFFAKKAEGSPIADLFGPTWEKKLLTGQNSIDIQLSRLKTLVEEGEYADLKENKLLMRLNSHNDNTKTIEVKNKEGKISHEEMYKHKILAFDYSYTMSVFEHNQLTEDFRELLYHEDSEIRDFAKNLVYYSILSKGFNSGTDSIIDIIPTEVWSDPGMSLDKNNPISMRDYFRKNIDNFESNRFFSSFVEDFIENNRNLKGLIPIVNSAKGKDNVYISKNTAAYNEEHGFAKYIKRFDYVKKEYSIFKFGSLSGNKARYYKIEPKGVPYKLQQYGFQDESIKITKEKKDSIDKRCRE